MKTKIITLKSIPFVGIGSRDIIWTTILTTAAVIIPGILAHTPHNQWITGTIINMILFLASWKLGIANAVLVGVVPSSVALLRGLLPAPMALLVPFIIISNCILVATFSLFKKRMLLGVVSASFLKSGFLYLATILLATKIASPLIVMMHLPQLATALAGGLLAYTFMKYVKNV